MTRSGKTTASKREAAVERILAGTSTVGREALRLRVSRQAVAQFVTQARKRRSDPLDLGILEDSPAADTERAPNAARLERAKQSAGVAQREDAGEVSDLPDSPGSSTPARPPTPEELVALCEALRMVGLRTYAGIIGADLDSPDVQAVFVFSESEKVALRLAAPYAAKYVPQVLGESDVVGAVGFVLIFAGSLVGAAQALRESVRERGSRGATAPSEGSPLGSAAIPGIKHGRSS